MLTTGGAARASSTLEALAIVARRFGLEAAAEQLQRSYALPPGEPTTDAILAIAQDMGLEARSLRVGFRDLPKLSKTLPAILRARNGSALVLEAASVDPTRGAIATLRDPSNPGAAPLVVDEVRLTEVWSGEMIVLKRRYAVADDQRPFSMGWLLGQLARERGLLLNISVAALVSTLFVLAPPFAIRIVLDRVIVNHSYSTLAVIAGAMAILLVFETAMSHLRHSLTEVLTTRVDGRMNLYLFEKLLKLPMDYFEKNPSGTIVSKLGRIWQVRSFLTGQLFGTFLETVPLLGLIPAMLLIQWQLSLFVISLALATALIIAITIPPIAERFKRVIRAEQKRSAHLVESLQGIRTIKALAVEGRRRRDWDRLIAEVVEARYELGRMSNVPRSLTVPLDRLMWSGALLLGAWMILESPDLTTPGAIMAFSMLSMRMASPLIQIARLQSDLGEVRAAIAEVASVMNAPAEDTRSSSGLRAPIKGEITFKDVRFRYSPDTPFALDGVSFTIPAGKMIGVVGRSGSGKTTVTRLLQGLHTGYEGLIKVDGMDLREIDLTHLRTSLGVVLQENFLFSGTIRDNIALAAPGASLSQIVRVAQMAGAEEFIERLPRGYDTVLEEGAVNLSGGQRQRLAIARALLVNPPVLMLDEATSALDAESEAIVNANLRRIGAERTILCISHRLSMLVQSDAIIVMERGKVYNMGTHAELLSRCDIYKHLWHQQNSHVDRAAAERRVAPLEQRS